MVLIKRQLIPAGFNLTCNVYKIKDNYFSLIPKNASNSILFGTKFRADNLSYSDVNKIKPRINIFIREPISRFQSGFIESIKRCSIFYENNSLANQSSVPTSKDIINIYGDIKSGLKEDPYNFISKVINLLNCGFYDPHLCPQWYFFTTLDCKTISNLSIYLLSDLEKVMRDLDLKIDLNYNFNSSFDTDEFNKKLYPTKIGLIKQKTKNLIMNFDSKLIRNYKKLNKFSKVQNIKRPSFQLISYDEWIECCEIIKDTIQNSNELQLKIKKLYKIDSTLHDELLEKNNIELKFHADISSLYGT